MFASFNKLLIPAVLDSVMLGANSEKVILANAEEQILAIPEDYTDCKALYL